MQRFFDFTEGVSFGKKGRLDEKPAGTEKVLT